MLALHTYGILGSDVWGMDWVLSERFKIAYKFFLSTAVLILLSIAQPLCNCFVEIKIILAFLGWNYSSEKLLSC